MEDGDRPFDPFDLAVDLDLDSTHRPPSRPSRFQPKLKGKHKAEPSTEQEPTPPLAEGAEPSQDPSTALSLTDGTEESARSLMEVDEGEDALVREIDVFCSPSPLDEDAQLYVMQYPLISSCRLDELRERCKEIRMKPEQSEVEVVLSVDVDSENYDKDVAEPLRFRKQTLSSSREHSVNCAVGILISNKLHLNPVHEVLQLRPSLIYLNDDGVQKKKHKSLEVGTKSDKPWVSLEYNAIDSTFSCIYQQKMVAQRDDHIHFMMKPSDYVNSLCPGTSTVKKTAKGPSRSFLPLAPLEERLKEWLRKECQVNRFDALMHLDSTASKEDFLNILQRHAYLVQGLWVPKSSLLYEGHEAIQRDYILFLFSKNHVIHYSKLKELNLNSDALKRLLSPLAYERPSLSDWKFKEECDLSFIKGYFQIVKEQECAWSSREKHLMESLRRVGKRLPVMPKHSPNPNMAKRSTAARKVDTGSNRSDDGTGSSAARAMSNETAESLSKALLQLFSDRKARSINSIRRELQDLALSKSSRPKEDSKTKALVAAAANAASVPLPDLLSVISQVAVKVQNVYVLKSGENPALDPLRNVVINLFRGKESNAKLKKQEIKQAALIDLERDISDNEYNQVVNELCIPSKGAWVLRSADNPE